MYIDKLYNKLYSEGDSTSLDILRQEIRVFSKEGGVIDQYTKNIQRSIADKLTNITKTVGKLLAVGVPVAGVITYLNNSQAGRDWLKENTGFDYDKTKDNLSNKWDQLTGNTLENYIPKGGFDSNPIDVPSSEGNVSRPQELQLIPEGEKPVITPSDSVKPEELDESTEDSNDSDENSESEGDSEE